MAAEKRKDAWDVEVLSRLQTCIDLVAAEAIYHKNCMIYFKRVKEGENSGRPISSSKAEAFGKLCEWLENECDRTMYSVQELYKNGRIELR